jgi:hypothetical protein
MKKCIDCREVRAASAFARNAARADGLNQRCRQCDARHYRKTYQSRYRAWYLKKHYGMSESEYDALLAAQVGRCAGCGATESGRRSTGQRASSGLLHVDHDHATGVVRGLLCHGCNIALGAVKDSSATLRKLAYYVDAGTEVAA